jgi:hypothetical protein
MPDEGLTAQGIHYKFWGVKTTSGKRDKIAFKTTKTLTEKVML